MTSVVLMFILIFAFIIMVPCIGIAWIGRNLIEQLGRYPSKTPAVQMSILLKLVILEVVSFSLILLFFKMLVA